MIFSRSLLSAGMCLLVLSSISQPCKEDINLEKISFRKVRKLLHKEDLSNTNDLNNIVTACYDDNHSDSFYTHVKTFDVEASAGEVWNAYMTIKPEDAWKGKMVNFGFLFSKKNSEIGYFQDAYPGMKTGQVVFINIRFLSGLINLAVGNEITEINPEQQSIRICYLSNGKSEGSQLIELTDLEDGKCRITHTTRYKSDSPFRDKNLYPFLHGLIITEFHRNVIYLAEKRHRELLARI